jgi:hypothetical protein
LAVGEPVAATADKNRFGMRLGHTLAPVTTGTVPGVVLHHHVDELRDACSPQADGGWLRH